jgi:hypothetical protein
MPPREGTKKDSPCEPDKPGMQSFVKNLHFVEWIGFLGAFFGN